MRDRKQEYAKLDEKFLPRLNEELREVWFNINQLAQYKPYLAGPDREQALGRRIAKVSRWMSFAASGAATSIVQAVVPLDGTSCIGGAPQFIKVDHVSTPTILLKSNTLGGMANYAGHALNIMSMDAKQIRFELFRDFTGGTVPQWDAIVMFDVSGTVARV